MDNQMRLTVTLTDLHGKTETFQCDHVTTDAQPTGFYVEKSFNNFVATRFSNNWSGMTIDDNPAYVDPWPEERAKAKEEREKKAEQND